MRYMALGFLLLAALLAEFSADIAAAATSAIIGVGLAVLFVMGNKGNKP